MTRQEALQHLKAAHSEELSKLPLKARIAKLLDLTMRYRAEHPDESAEWSAQYI